MAAPRNRCSSCANVVTASQIRSGQARANGPVLLCPRCHTRERMQVQVAQDPRAEARRTGWLLSAATTGVLSMYFLYSRNPLDMAVGVLFLAATAVLVFYKVFDSETA